MSLLPALENAWALRTSNGSLLDREALRIYHGHTEGSKELPRLAIEKFQDHYWVFEWENPGGVALTDTDIGEVSRWLQARGGASAVLLRRPAAGIPQENAGILFGEPPERVVVQESRSIPAVYEIHFQQTRHPGLFLDHFPLRQWLKANVAGRSVLNTFAYTGSLSMVAGKGGAREVTTLDLSRPTTEWGQRNWQHNGLGPTGDFIYGDVFDWLPRFIRRNRSFDLVILDPPSFSRTKTGTFSTNRDLPRLHALALDLLPSGGTLITSINSENIPQDEFHRIIVKSARDHGRTVELQEALQACPATFPGATHLKGGIYSVR